jgi:gas vesicle protein
MSEKPESEIAAEFRRLGKSLREAFEAAKDSEELKKLRQELEEGVEAMASSIRRSADEFVHSDTGQQIRQEVKDLEEKWKRGEVQSKVRQELLQILRRINADLDEALDRWQAEDKGPSEKSGGPR